MQKTKFTILLHLIISAVLLVYSNGFTKGITGKSGMVVTAHPIASEFGLKILQSGGNAIDAAVGAAIVIGVVEPNASGLGGGGGMLIYLEGEDSLTYINYYARAPRLVTTNFSRETESSTAKAVLVPGTVAGLSHALKNYGSISWEQLLTQAIDQVDSGFQVDKTLHKLILDSYEKLIKYPQTSATYLEEGFPPQEGHRIVNHRILKTLKKLANGGPEVFYRGEIADSIEAAIIKYDGGIRKSDLMKYRPIETNPVQGSYRGYEIVSAPPPQSGIALIEILHILEFKNLSRMGHYTKNPASFHFLAEAMKRGYADRLHYLSDPMFRDVPVNTLLSKNFANIRYQTINMKKAAPERPKSTPYGDVSEYKQKSGHKNKDGSTTHISVIDSDGNAVSLTQTLNRFWGSGISVCGFLLNNGMTAFSTSNPANTVASNRQPRSTISPSLIFEDDQLRLVIGSPGGGRIISTLVEVISNIVDFGKSPQEANQLPRFCSRKWTDTIPVESRFSPELLDQLEKMGHPIEVKGEMDLYFGGVQLVFVDQENKIYIGSSDPRRSGVVMGY